MVWLMDISAKPIAGILARVVALIILVFGALAVLPHLYNTDSDLALMAVPIALGAVVFVAFLIVRSLWRTIDRAFRLF